MNYQPWLRGDDEQRPSPAILRLDALPTMKWRSLGYLLHYDAVGIEQDEGLMA